MATGSYDGAVLEVDPTADDVAAEDEGIHGATDVPDKLELGGDMREEWGIVCEERFTDLATGTAQTLALLYAVFASAL